jgi:hypothetical protein
MTEGQFILFMTRSWISDTPDEVEHPPIPLGLNRMAVPRAALVLSLFTGVSIILSSVWIGISAMSFLDDIDASFGSTDVELLKEEGRWSWEVGFLLDTCLPREDNWDMPESLSDQNSTFLYPGELRCDWEHQGQEDLASVSIFNRGNESLNLVLEISGGGVLFSETNEPYHIINDLAPDESVIKELILIEVVSERQVSISATHISVLQAQVRLDLNVYQGVANKDVHIEDGEPFVVEYTLWDADSNDELDSGDWADIAGDGCNWSISGFCWSVIGLDIDNDRGLIPGISTGTSQTTLLPPDLAYGNSDGHELEETWLRFELRLTSAPVS